MLKERLLPFIDRYNEISDLLCQPEVVSDIKRMTTLSKEQSNMSNLVDKANEYINTINSIEENKEMLDDVDLGELAKEELKELEPQIPLLEEEIKFLLIPKDPNDNRNAYIEMRAGAGGDEAAIFVGDLFQTYMRYIELRGWKAEIMNLNEGEFGGYKEAVILIKGENVFGRLKYESGTHRV
jgi:peptide chain release factor 1